MKRKKTQTYELFEETHEKLKPKSRQTFSYHREKTRHSCRIGRASWIKQHPYPPKIKIISNF